MQKPDSLKLYLNFRKYEAPPKFKGLIDVDDEIYSQLIYNPNHEYHVKSKVSEETFSLFLEYWISGKEPLITQNNLFEYAQLSEEFKIMKEVIQKAKNSFDVCEQNLYKLKHLKNIDKKSIEQTISSNLDLYIEKQGENLISLDIQTLYNIFSQSNENFSKHNEAYNLIKKHYEKYKDDAIFILLPILESEKLTYSNFKEIIDESETRFGFLPKKVIIFFEEQNKKIEELSKLFQQSQTELKQTKEELEQAKEELEHTKKENEGYKNVISLQKGELDSLKLENVEKNKKIGQIESHLIERDNEISQKLEEMKAKTREYNSLQTQFDKKVEEVKKQNNLLTKKDEEIAKLGTEIKERNQEKALLQTTINNKISEISRLEKIISDKEREIRSLQTKVESAQNECKRLNKYIDDETVRIYDKGDYSKITYISYSSDQKGDENKKNYAMEITRKSFNMHNSNYDRAKYVVNQLENRYAGKWCVIINLQFHGDCYFTYYDNCYFGFSIGEYDVTVFKAHPNC